ncbi:multisubunit sodium/proton antiporter, MrpF subunit (TC 2.A.63.1) [Desulfonatronum thiosulfatophilum]|uniref:Multisubunit sodium/proton antiporter, MrpF subunit (TC 2.A.63.1) n=1 Tax=Desulfonatronum thiosulfatophilum TaxID=617002 RepID=A0A1G6DKF3_9BACT|nr:monovalent cation/H+ antiporter complex subunit F [Desulfonatronum thiosulfatophilum]SDB45596.1 multisubunit sodium/proton antiporter, MrpF subunit (TC 2.A.63.1) [Desulfonatronum thiosulfatophilum]
MTAYYLWLALVLLVTMLAGLVRVIIGPKPADRILGAQLFGTTGVAVLLLMGAASDSDSLRNVALAFVLLALLALIAFVERIPPEADTEEKS